MYIYMYTSVYVYIGVCACVPFRYISNMHCGYVWEKCLKNLKLTWVCASVIFNLNAASRSYSYSWSLDRVIPLLLFICWISFVFVVYCTFCFCSIFGFLVEQKELFLVFCFCFVTLFVCYTFFYLLFVAYAQALSLANYARSHTLALCFFFFRLALALFCTIAQFVVVCLTRNYLRAYNCNLLLYKKMLACNICRVSAPLIFFRIFYFFLNCRLRLSSQYNIKILPLLEICMFVYVYVHVFILCVYYELLL